MNVERIVKIRACNKNNRFLFPNLSVEKNMIPGEIIITELDGTIPNDINVRLFCGKLDLGDFQESYFISESTINLIEYNYIFKKGNSLEILLNTLSADPKEYNIRVSYIESYGTILYQTRTENFDNILNDIYEKGHCTRLIITSDKKIKNLKIKSICQGFKNTGDKLDPESDDWFYPFAFEQDEDNNYVIEFTGSKKIYAEYLNFMKITVDNDKSDELYLYIIAYGYNKSRNE